jgi:hypothetical protein
METKTVNLRDMPEDLVRRAKAYAAWRGMSLKGFIVEVMQQALDSVPGTMSLFAHATGTKDKAKKKRK